MDIFLAYLDPGSGSMIVQAVVAGAAGAAVAVKVYWRRLKSKFTRKPAMQAATPSGARTEEEAG